MNEMTQERESRILEKAVDMYGHRSQVTVAMEECSELIQALSKWLRLQRSPKETPANVKYVYEHVREEMADVSIMLNQLVLIFGDYNEQEISKLERLEKRLNDAFPD